MVVLGPPLDGRTVAPRDRIGDAAHLGRMEAVGGMGVAGYGPAKEGLALLSYAPQTVVVRALPPPV